MNKTYTGKYVVKNKKKYEGDWTNVYYRSSWERAVFKWCDTNPDILKWSSEETVIPYVCKTDNKYHRYFVDIKMTTKEGIFLIEIKPECQTVAPKVPKRRTKKYIKEGLTYVKNRSKWEAAERYCKKRGWTFKVWTENTLKGMGIKII